MKWNLYPSIVSGLAKDTFLLFQESTSAVKQISLVALGMPLRNIAAMKAVPVGLLDDGTTIKVAGYTTPGDGGGGNFTYSASSVAATNLGTVFAPNSGSGRFIRSYTGPIYAKWFGVTGDGSTDDYASIVSALSVANGSEIIFGAGKFYFNTALAINNFVKITGSVFKDGDTSPETLGAGTIFKPGPSAKDGLYGASIIINAGQINNVIVDGSLTSGAVGVLVGSSLCLSPMLEKMRIYGFTGLGACGLKVRNVVQPSFNEVHVDGCSTNLILTPEANNGSPTTVWFKNCYFSRSTTGPGAFHTGGYLATFDNCVFESNKQQGFLLTGRPASPGDYYTSILRDCWFEDNWMGNVSTSNYQCEQDSPGVGAGIHLDNCKFQATDGADNLRLWQSRCTTLSRLQFFSTGKHVRIEQALSSVQFLTPVYGPDGFAIDPFDVIENPDSASITGPWIGQILGTQTDDDAASGNIGEIIESSVGAGVAVALTTGLPSNVTSIVLTPGDWDIFGTILYQMGAGCTLTSVTSACSNTTLDFAPADSAINLFGISWAENGNDPSFSLPQRPEQVADGATKTVYLTARSTFSGGTCKAYGFIRARRRR